jgi:undecaprenyl-diphosphatase
MANLGSLDYQLFQFFNNWAGKSAVFDWIVVFIAHYFAYFLAGVLIVYILYKFKDSNVRKWAASGLATFFLSRFILVEIIRMFFYRQRPFIAHKVIELFPKGPEASFPSGHTAGIVALGMGIYFYNKRLGLFIIVLGLLVGFSRIIAGVHYPSDVLAGAIIGIISGWLVHWFVKYRKI